MFCENNHAKTMQVFYKCRRLCHPRCSSQSSFDEQRGPVFRLSCAEEQSRLTVTFRIPRQATTSNTVAFVSHGLFVTASPVKISQTSICVGHWTNLPRPPPPPPPSMQPYSTQNPWNFERNRTENRSLKGCFKNFYCL